MRIDKQSTVEFRRLGKALFASGTRFGPACGIAACACAQVALLKNLNGDAGSIGRALAGALTGTLYGTLCQNMLTGSLAAKLGLRSSEEHFTRDIILQGVLSIPSGANRGLIESRLVSIVDPKAKPKFAKAA